MRFASTVAKEVWHKVEHLRLHCRHRLAFWVMHAERKTDERNSGLHPLSKDSGDS